MKRLIRALAAASLAIAAVAAAPALAHDREPCAPTHHHPAGTYYPAPPPAPPVRSPVRFERRELRRDYAELEIARKRFYATWNGSPGKARKFERWYATRKAELDRRWVALAANW